jgi:hypothetical protein
MRRGLFPTVEHEFAMKSKFLSAVSVFVMSLPVFADEAVVAAVPRGDTDPTALIVSAVLFFAMIVAFAAYVFRKGNSGKDDGTE